MVLIVQAPQNRSELSTLTRSVTYLGHSPLLYFGGGERLFLIHNV